MVEEAISRIPDGAILMVGGFIGIGTPERLIDELVKQGKRELTVIANDTATPGVGVGKQVNARLLRKLVANHIGTNSETHAVPMDLTTRAEIPTPTPGRVIWRPHRP
jgi:acetate CoA/acetoacetate CoA-transferase alpha subunit